jgi:hypothetical protein
MEQQEQKKHVIEAMTEIYTVGLQEQIRYIKPKELATLNQKYKETSKDVNTKKLLEQLLLSIPLVLIHDTKLQKLGTDRWISLVYSVREELSSLFDFIETHYK